MCVTRSYLFCYFADICDTPLWEVRVSLQSHAPHLLLVTTRKGVVRHMSTALAALLGVGRPADEGMNDPNEQSGAVVVTGLKLQDFLPSPWRDIHTRLFRETNMTTPIAYPFGCRVPAPTDPSAAAAATGGFGPSGMSTGNGMSMPGAAAGSLGTTMAVVDSKGRSLYLRTSVSTIEDAGEVLHAARFESSSAEEGAAERRLRLRVSPDGVIQAVSSGTSAALFGVEPQSMVGAHVWDYISLVSPWQDADEQGQNAAEVAAPLQADIGWGGAARPTEGLPGKVEGSPSEADHSASARTGPSLQAAKARKMLDALVKR